jgi:hypothetical protein
MMSRMLIRVVLPRRSPVSLSRTARLSITIGRDPSLHSQCLLSVRSSAARHNGSHRHANAGATLTPTVRSRSETAKVLRRRSPVRYVPKGLKSTQCAAQPPAPQPPQVRRTLPTGYYHHPVAALCQ